MSGGRQLKYGISQCDLYNFGKSFGLPKRMEKVIKAEGGRILA